VTQKKQREAEDLNDRINNNQQSLDDLMNYHPFATTNRHVNGNDGDDGDDSDDGDDGEYAEVRRTLDELPIPLAMQNATPTPTPRETIVLPSFSSYPRPSAPRMPVAYPVPEPPPPIAPTAPRFPEAANWDRQIEGINRTWAAGKQEFGKYAHAPKRK